MPVTVLIADDDPIFREILSRIITKDPEIKVIGTAGDGREAVRLAAELKPNLVVMDLIMPVMDGMTAISQIMARYQVPIVVVTGMCDTITVARAISKGALEVITKDKLFEMSADKFIHTLKVLSRVKVIRHIKSGRDMYGADLKTPVSLVTGAVVAIASSTGGPRALSSLLSNLSGTLSAPILIAQHIDSYFLPEMVRWLTGVSMLNIVIAEDGEPLKDGTVYFAPPDNHIQAGPGRRIRLKPREPKDIYVPSGDFLLTSVAAAIGEKSIGVILTGMGGDGAAGLGAIKAAGGITIAQDEETSVVFGMPKVAIESGCVDLVLPLEGIAPAIEKILSGGDYLRQMKVKD